MVYHELGHVLGLSHDARGPLGSTLATGVRDVPAFEDDTSRTDDRLDLSGRASIWAGLRSARWARVDTLQTHHLGALSRWWILADFLTDPTDED